MKESLNFWIARKKSLRQSTRMVQIFEQLRGPLSDLGYDARVAFVFEDGFEASAGQTNVWLASDVAEMPPIPGTNILWFLTQMKIVPHSVLLAFDGLWTASLTHKDFLEDWLGGRALPQVIDWPLARPHPRDLHRWRPNALLHMEPDNATALLAGDRGRIAHMPGTLSELYRHLSSYETVVSHLRLRERMCGFTYFEELVAIAAGCRLISGPRDGLSSAVGGHIYEIDAELAPRFETDIGTQRPTALTNAFWGHHDPHAIARAMVRGIARAKEHRRPTWPRRPPTEGQAVQQELNISCQRFVADHAAFAAREAPSRQGDEAWRETLRRPLLPATPHMLKSGPNESLSDLSNELKLASQALSEAEAARQRAIAQALAHFDPELSNATERMLRNQGLPWPSVLAESAQVARDKPAVSRALNGHNEYRFLDKSHSERALSPFISVPDAREAAETPRHAILLHAYYLPEAFDILSILAESTELPRIFVSTESQEKREALREHLKILGWTRATVDVVENRGRDIAPKLVHFAPKHEKFDYVLHLHTKRSPHTGALENWGQNLV
ncbi:MAG: rhamnan synthesis F family protein, partial [Pseudomonadota bacterium]